MRNIIIASHAHFAAGINEALELLTGPHENVRVICLFVDGNDDVETICATAVEEAGEGDVIVCTDLFGGSVNNEFTKQMQLHDNVYLITNMNLPLLLQLVFSDDDQPTADLLRELASSDDTRVKFVNDLLTEGVDDDDEF